MDVKLLDEIARKPLGEITPTEAAKVAAAVLEGEKRRTVVDVAMFGSAI